MHDDRAHRERDKIWNCLVIWEAMLEMNTADYDRQRKGAARSQMLEIWESVGVNEMREMAMDLEPWVQGVFDQLEMILGDDPLDTLDLIPFDWEFVPYLLKHFVDWTRYGTDVPPVDEVAAKIVAMTAHGIQHAA